VSIFFVKDMHAYLNMYIMKTRNASICKIQNIGKKIQYRENLRDFFWNKRKTPNHEKSSQTM